MTRKNIFVKFVFIKGWKKSEQTPPFMKTMKTCVENLKILQGWSSAAIWFEFVPIRAFDEVAIYIANETFDFTYF